MPYHECNVLDNLSVCLLVAKLPEYPPLPDGREPIKAPVYPGDVGYDLAANLPVDPAEISKLISMHESGTISVDPVDPTTWYVNPHCHFDIPVGICAEIGWHLDVPNIVPSISIRPRSSTWRKKRLDVAFGTIDIGYRGPWMFCVYNGTNNPVAIKRGEYLAQAVIELCVTPSIIVARPQDLSPSVRGDRGFGSSTPKV